MVSVSFEAGNSCVFRAAVAGLLSRALGGWRGDGELAAGALLVMLPGGLVGKTTQANK